MTSKYLASLLFTSALAVALGLAGIIGIQKALPEKEDRKMNNAPNVLIVPVMLENDKSESISKDTLTDIINHLSTQIAFSYTIGKIEILPEDFLDKKRNQVNAQLALGTLNSRYRKEQAFRVIFLIREDLFLPGYNFIFGLALPGGKSAIISDAQLISRNFTISEKDKRKLYLRRLAKVSLHELGHTLMLSHSKNPKSVMKYHNSVSELDTTGDYLLLEDKERIINRYPFLKEYVK